jgi:hypothetical protein
MAGASRLSPNPYEKVADSESELTSSDNSDLIEPGQEQVQQGDDRGCRESSRDGSEARRMKALAGDCTFDAHPLRGVPDDEPSQVDALLQLLNAAHEHARLLDAATA